MKPQTARLTYRMYQKHTYYVFKNSFLAKINFSQQRNMIERYFSLTVEAKQYHIILT